MCTEREVLFNFEELLSFKRFTDKCDRLKSHAVAFVASQMFLKKFPLFKITSRKNFQFLLKSSPNYFYSTGARFDFMYCTQWTVWNWKYFSQTEMCFVDKEREEKVIRSLFVTVACCVSGFRRTIGCSSVVVVRDRGNATNQRSIFLWKLRTEKYSHNYEPTSPMWKLKIFENIHAATIFLINKRSP